MDISRLNKSITDNEPPSNMYISKTCEKNHGIGGNTLKYKTNNRCVFCQLEYNRSRATRDVKPEDEIRKKALDTFEELNSEKDYYDLL